MVLQMLVLIIVALRPETVRWLVDLANQWSF